MSGPAIGIDVGGTKTKACLVRVGDGVVLDEETRPTPCAEGGGAVLALVTDLAAEMRRRAGARAGEGAALGVCLPELVGTDGEPGSAWNFEWRGLDFRTPLGGAPHIESDVRSAAFAEGRFGAGRGRRIFVYVTLSTGMSHTLVVDGHPYAGARGYAIHFAGAELVAFTGPGEDVEVRQNLELFASGKALGERYGRAIGDPATTARDLFEAEATDRHAARIVDTGLTAIASYLGQLVNILDPEVLVLGGGIGGHAAINARLAERTRHFIFADLARDLPIVPAGLGDRACAVGAAVLAQQAHAGGADGKPRGG